MKKKDSGITLIALTVTIIILIILFSTTFYAGKNAIYTAKEQRFVEQLKEINEAVQLNINDYKNLDEYRDLEETKKTITLGDKNIEYHLKLETEEDYNKIGLSNINDIIYVNLETTEIYSDTGYDGKYTLKQFGIEYYEPEQKSEEIQEVFFRLELETDNDEWRIVAKEKYINCNGKVEDGNLVYSKYIDGENHIWKRVLKRTKDNKGKITFYFEPNEFGKYEFKFIDSKGYESEVKTVTVLERDGNIILTN